jgi:hypothetical protein
VLSVEGLDNIAATIKGNGKSQRRSGIDKSHATRLPAAGLRIVERPGLDAADLVEAFKFIRVDRWGGGFGHDFAPCWGGVKNFVIWRSGDLVIFEKTT